jgi:outer membrane protein TolC
VARNVTCWVWGGGRERAERAATTAQADAVRARLSDFDRAVAVEVRERQLSVSATEAAIDASVEAVTAATEALRVVGERFDNGVASSTDVLDAELAQLEAELEQTRLRATLRIEEARLVRTVGRP